MRVIIAGSRSITDMAVLERAIENADFWITEVILGCARGVDELGKMWVKIQYSDHSTSYPCRIFYADWKKYGKKAGPLRNEQMAQNADALIAVWDGKSRGTADMIARARRHGLQVHVEEVA